MSAAVHALPAPTAVGDGFELMHLTCCEDDNLALCATDVTNDQWSSAPINCAVCRELDARLMADRSCAAVCPLTARKEL